MLSYLKFFRTSDSQQFNVDRFTEESFFEIPSQRLRGNSIFLRILGLSFINRKHLFLGFRNSKYIFSKMQETKKLKIYKNIFNGRQTDSLSFCSDLIGGVQNARKENIFENFKKESLLRLKRFFRKTIF